MLHRHAFLIIDIWERIYFDATRRIQNCWTSRNYECTTSCRKHFYFFNNQNQVHQITGPFWCRYTIRSRPLLYGCWWRSMEHCVYIHDQHTMTNKCWCCNFSFLKCSPFFKKFPNPILSVQIIMIYFGLSVSKSC